MHKSHNLFEHTECQGQVQLTNSSEMEPFSAVVVAHVVQSYTKPMLPSLTLCTCAQTLPLKQTPDKMSIKLTATTIAQ